MNVIQGCNCCGTCEITSDDFNRSNGTDIDTGSSAGWTEESGSWDITSNELRCTSPGIAVCDTTHSTSDMVVTVDFKHDTSGRAVDIIVARVDANNFFRVRYIPGGNNIGILKTAAGVTTTLNSTTDGITITTGVWYTAKVCVSADDGTISAYLDGTVKISSSGQTLTGTGCGLGCSGTGTATFDDFVLTKAYNAATDTGCEQCVLKAEQCDKCTSGTTPTQWQVDITGGTVWDGTYIVSQEQGISGGGGGYCSGDTECCWGILLGGSPCGGAPLIDRVILELNPGSSFKRFSFGESGGGLAIQWVNNTGGSPPIDCGVAITFPPLGIHATGCTQSGTTCIGTPL